MARTARQNSNPSQMNLFGTETKTVERTMAASLSPDSRIFVSRVSHIESAEENVRDLFEGYRRLFAITYSYGIREMEKVMSLFEHGEVIVGCADLVGFSLAGLMARQHYVVSQCAKGESALGKRMEKGEFEVHVLNDMISHEKIYLLEGEGKWRTILASANFSGQAWNGTQRENFVVCDDKSCFDVYMDRFLRLRDLCSPVISGGKPMPEEIDPDNIPVVRKAQARGVVLIDVSGQTKENLDYGFYISEKTAEIRSFLSKANLARPGDRVIELTAEKAVGIKAESRLQNERSAERKKVFPQFVIDYAEKTASLNGEMLDLNPDKREVESDIRVFEQYMANFNEKFFVGDVKRLRLIYWKTLNYMFASPFIAMIRHEIGNSDSLRYMPIYLLLSGASDAGKTAFVKFVRKMMFGTPYSVSLLDKKFFTVEQSAGLKTGVKGYPALIDEITPGQWGKAHNIVKDDFWLIDGNYREHPCFVLITNEINGVKPELSKRVMVMYPDCRMSRDAAIGNGSIVEILNRRMGTALYRKYVSLMLERMPDFLADVRDRASSPDIWALSSKTLREIFDCFEAASEYPAQTWQDYIGEKNICDRAIQTLLDEYRNNPGIFRIDRKKNRILLDFSSYDSNEAQKTITSLSRELPAIFRCRKLGNALVMDLKATEDFTGMKFSRSVFSSIIKKFGL